MTDTVTHDWVVLELKSTSDVEYEIECERRRARGMIISPRESEISHSPRRGKAG